MPKPKQQKQEEAIARKRDNLAQRLRHLTLLYNEGQDSWTLKRLRQEIERFQSYLKECGWPHEYALYFRNNEARADLHVVPATRPGLPRDYKCPYCHQFVGTRHFGHFTSCNPDAFVQPHEGMIYARQK